MVSKQKLTQQTNLTINNITGFFKAKVTPIDNGAKIGYPKGHLGKHIYIITLKK